MKHEIEYVAVRFLCRACGQTAADILRFSIATEVHVFRQWILTEETETTDGMATCEHCGCEQQVWPKVYTDKKWQKRDQKRGW